MYQVVCKILLGINKYFNKLLSQLERNLTSPEWAREFRVRVNDEKTYSDWRHYDAMFESADDHGTAHVIVVAPDGSAASVTSTINYM